jgi:hypothetical protein
MPFQKKIEAFFRNQVPGTRTRGTVDTPTKESISAMTSMEEDSSLMRSASIDSSIETETDHQFWPQNRFPFPPPLPPNVPPGPAPQQVNIYAVQL